MMLEAAMQIRQLSGCTSNAADCDHIVEIDAGSATTTVLKHCQQTLCSVRVMHSILLVGRGRIYNVNKLHCGMRNHHASWNAGGA